MDFSDGQPQSPPAQPSTSASATTIVVPANQSTKLLGYSVGSAPRLIFSAGSQTRPILLQLRPGTPSGVIGASPGNTVKIRLPLLSKEKGTEANNDSVKPAPTMMMVVGRDGSQQRLAAMPFRIQRPSNIHTIMVSQGAVGSSPPGQTNKPPVPILQKGARPQNLSTYASAKPNNAVRIQGSRNIPGGQFLSLLKPSPPARQTILEVNTQNSSSMQVEGGEQLKTVVVSSGTSGPVNPRVTIVNRAPSPALSTKTDLSEQSEKNLRNRSRYRLTKPTLLDETYDSASSDRGSLSPTGHPRRRIVQPKLPIYQPKADSLMRENLRPIPTVLAKTQKKPAGMQMSHRFNDEPIKKTPMILQRSPKKIDMPYDRRLPVKSYAIRKVFTSTGIESATYKNVSISTEEVLFDRDEDIAEEVVTSSSSSLQAVSATVPGNFMDTDSGSVCSDTPVKPKQEDSETIEDLGQAKTGKEELDPAASEPVEVKVEKPPEAESQEAAVPASDGSFSAMAISAEEWEREVERERTPPPRIFFNRLERSPMKNAKIVVVPASHQNYPKPMSIFKRSPIKPIVHPEEGSTQSEDDDPNSESNKNHRTFSPRKQRLRTLSKAENAVFSVRVRGEEADELARLTANGTTKRAKKTARMKEYMQKALEESIANISSARELGSSPILNRSSIKSESVNSLTHRRPRSRHQKALFHDSSEGKKAEGVAPLLPSLIDNLLGRRGLKQEPLCVSGSNGRMMETKHEEKVRGSSSSPLASSEEEEDLSRGSPSPPPVPTLDLLKPLERVGVRSPIQWESVDKVDSGSSYSLQKNALGYYEVQFGDKPDENSLAPPDEGIRECKRCHGFGLAEDFFSLQYCSARCIYTKDERNLGTVANPEKRKLANTKNETPSFIDGTGRGNLSDSSSDSGPVDTSRFLLATGSFSWPLYFAWGREWSSSENILGTRPFGRSLFQVGQKLEAIDPQHPGLICVTTVVDTCGRRIKLHFDGYDSKFDFWVHDWSQDIFPVGWCEKNRQTLQKPPKNMYLGQFSWENYLKNTKSEAAPATFFSVQPNKLSSKLKVGMKLEAVDRKHDRSVCVATVNNVIGNRILVHFDSWDDRYDYWTELTSPHVFQAGHAATKKEPLTVPNGWTAYNFVWEEYLKATNSEAVPSNLFQKRRRPIEWKPKMKVEAVDQRNPGFIRVATASEVDEYSIKVHYDGWPEYCDVVLDDDSPDLFPPGWCNNSSCTLLPPLFQRGMSPKASSECPTPGCTGLGSARWFGKLHHSTKAECPYSPENVDKDERPERLPTSKVNFLSPVKLNGEETEAYEETSKKRKRQTSGDEASPSPRQRSDTENQEFIRTAVFTPGYTPKLNNMKPPGWDKVSQTFWTKWKLRFGKEDLPSCTCQEVADLVSEISGRSEAGDKIRDQELDGEALCMLSQSDLTDILGLKLGPAIKLYSMIKCFQ